MSSQTTGIPYEGKALASRQRCYWRVRAWDGFYQPTVYSGAASWEMGLLSPSDWRAKWIGSGPDWSGSARYFRYGFTITRPVKDARIYIAGAGSYELHIDGAPVNDRVQRTEPAGSIETVPYYIYDVRDSIKQGENVLGVLAANGSNEMPKVLVQAEVEYEDGGRELLYSDEGTVAGRTWTVTSGPILRTSNADGEVYDARLEKTGSDMPEVGLPKPEEWAIVHRVDPPAGRLVCQSIHQTKIVATLHPQSVTEPRSGVFVFDLGQSIQGWPELRVQSERGKAITTRCADNLAADGTVDQQNRSKALAADIFISKGGGEESWEPRFSIRSFRYVQVEGFPGHPKLGDVLIKRIDAPKRSLGK